MLLLTLCAAVDVVHHHHVLPRLEQVDQCGLPQPLPRDHHQPHQGSS